MEVQKFRITRKNAPSYWSIPCSGGTDYWPINYSTNCSGVTMYNSTTSDVEFSLSGDMTTFPEELRGCSIANPCVLLNDQFTSTNINQCTNIGEFGYVKFMGLKAIFGGTFLQNGSYNELIHLKDLTNSNQYSFTPNVGACYCLDPLDENLSQITLKLTQDFNDIGHYSIWDGNISQKEIFSNFIVTADTNNPMKIRVYNTTDFSYYKSLQDSPYTISFGGAQQATLQYPNLSTAHTYTNTTPMQKKITITQETPWGPMSVTQTIWVPFMSYQQLKALGPTVGIPPQEYPIYNHLGVQISSGYHEISPGTPWDSGTDIMQYSALSPTSCFDVSGVTESMLNLFQTYSSTPSGSAYLPAGYFELVPVELGSDVINPVTNEIVPAMIGQITQATNNYTAYTISSGVNNAATVELYDFSNGITLYNATSCGLNSLAFGAYDCFKCLIEDCSFCETKDEYTDRITGVPMSILSGPAFQKGVWSPSIDYVRGDIVFDENYGQCCCYMAVVDINQTSAPSPWAGVPPTDTYQGVWYDNGLPTKHLWEACDLSCLVCPPGTTIPCNDPTIVQLAPEISLGVPLLGGIYANGNGYTTGQYVSGLDGNCYQALLTGNLGSPSAFTNSNEWDYIGCGSWICPQDLTNVSTTSCDFINASALTVTTPQGPFTLTGYPFYGDCVDDFNDGECYPDRWLCGDEFGNITQYSCNGCVEITTNNPQYTNFDPADPYAGPVFQQKPDCMAWCEPPAWSCTTSNGPGGECCSLISCAEDFLTGIPVYTSLITNVINTLPSVIPAPFSQGEYIANVHQLYFEYGDWLPDAQWACNHGVPLISETCCDYTGWNYDCEQGCYEVTLGGNYPTQFSCQTANPAGITQCGWSCETMNSPCIPCYSLGCGWPVPNEDLCNQNCTALTTCIVCDCASQTPCSMYADPNNGGQPGCPYWPPDPLGSPPTFTSYTQCDEYCECDVGWDCVLNDDGTPTSEGCTQYPSAYVMAQLGVMFSQPPPFTGYATSGECCEATRCCHAACNDDDFIAGTGTTQMFPVGYYPCHWFLPLGNVEMCSPGGPNVAGATIATQGLFGLPYCDIVECTTDLCVIPNTTPDEYECCPDADSCMCACNWLEPDPGNPVFTDKGYWDNNLFYGEGDIVSYWDPNSPGTMDNPCCYLCACPWLGVGTAGTDPFGYGIVYDCTIFTPDDGPATDGTPNCWLSCDHTAGGATPSPICGEPCGPCCGGASGDTFECTPDGCINSPCVIDVNFSETSQNCYSDLGNCDGECGASCFCSENQATGVDETGCVSQYDWLTNSDTILQMSTAIVPYPNYPPLVPPGLFAPSFPLATLNDCLAIATPTGFLDCCDTTGMTYNCDDSSNCEPMSNTAGLGCIPIPSGHPSYPGDFNSLSACQEWCTWTCNPDPLSFAGCSCTFLSNPSAPPVPTYVSAFDCWMHTNNCDCCTPTTYFCDQYGAINGLYNTPGISACVSESYINSQSVAVQSQAWGVGQLSYFNGGTGFASLQDCEDQCVFCCQCTPPGGGYCELEWGQTLCCTGAVPQLNPSDCQITTVSTIGYYPCSGATTEYYCDDIDGCTGYLVTNPPTTFASGPYFDMVSCQAECNFLCGDCVNGCVCVFLNQTTTCSPVFDSMTGCTFSVNSGPYTNSPTDNCCNCYDCIQIGSVNYYTWDIVNSTWILSNTTMSIPPTPSTLGSIWDNTTLYQLGDVVLFTNFISPTSSSTCCYVCVTTNYVQPTHGNLTPFQWYEAYWNDYQTNTQVWENGGGTGNLIWIPCDTGCIGPVNVITWNCIEGTQTNSCDGLVFLDGATDPTLPWAGGLIPDFSEYMQYIAIASNGLQSTPHSGIRVETAGNSACDTSYGGQWMSVGLKIKSCNADPVADAAIPGGGLSTTSYADFVNQATMLGILGLNLSNTHPENWAAYQTHCGQSNNEAGNWTAWAVTYGIPNNTLNTNGYDYADPNLCTCTQSPCYCNSVIGNGGSYNSEQDCQDVIDSFGPNAHPCCVSASTGYFVCDVGAACSCIFDPNAFAGYATSLDCENDSGTCCFIPIPWECVNSFTPTSYTDGCSYPVLVMPYTDANNLTNIGWDLTDITIEMTNNNNAYPTNLWGYETVIATHGINADFTTFKWASYQLHCPSALQGTTCCRHPNNDYQYVKGKGMNNLILDAIAGSVQTFYTLKDYIDTAVSLGAPANQLNSGLNPLAYGVYQGYQCDYSTIAHIIGNSLGFAASIPNGCASEVGGSISFINCDRFNIEPCCTSDCVCVQNASAVAPNSFIDSISCENDPNYCCYVEEEKKWACFDWGDGECECIPNPGGTYDNKMDCENDYPYNCCSEPPPPGMYVCDGNCACVWDPLATIGFPNLPTCQASQTTCCFIPPPGFWVCQQQGGSCYCSFDATALSGYLNIGACQTDTTTCCGPVTYFRCFDWGDGECECLIDPTCLAPGGGCYPNITLCQNDYGVNCCSRGVDESWDCVNGVCNDPGTGGGQYTTYAACVAICTPVLMGCEDCSTTLAPYLTAQITFQGNYNISNNYPINNCVVDQDTDCCYCCVNWGILPNGNGPQNPTTLQAKMSAPPRCELGYQPSLSLGQNVGGGMWMECGFDNNGHVCSTEPGECGDCAVTLVNDLTGPLTYKPWINNSNYYVNDCLVKPSGQNCCYCCVPQAKKSNALAESSTIPCNVNGNQLVANFGYQWKNCGVDVDGDDCTGLPDTCVKCCQGRDGYITQLIPNHPTCICPQGEVEVNCHTSNDPCRDMPASSCCGKCSLGAVMNPAHGCYSFCQQWGFCCGVGPAEPHDAGNDIQVVTSPCIQTESCARGHQWSWSECKCVVSRINLTER